MNSPLKIAIVGLDTSHAVEFPRLMQDPSIPEERRVSGMRATRCLRFETPFQDKEGLDKRQAVLEKIGILVTADFEEAVADCDAILIEINDPSLHLEYFRKCAPLGKPVFLDKPFADTFEHAQAIQKIAEEYHVRFFTASSLRYDVDFQDALAKNVHPASAVVWGALGKAPAGSSIVWYGVHTFEMLERIMGPGAATVQTVPDRKGVVCLVSYPDGRRGTVELTSGSYRYGGVIRDDAGREELFVSTGRIPFYKMLLDEILRFLRDDADVLPLAHSFEVMGMLDAAERSLHSGRMEVVYR